MKRKENRSYQAPEVDTKGLEKRKLLEAQLLSLDAQVRNFGRIRDRFVAYGQDSAAYYKKVQGRRDEIARALKKLAPSNSPPRAGAAKSPYQRPDGPLLKAPITPARFIRDLGVFGFGTSGYVQTAAASEGVNDVVRGNGYPPSGKITTIPGAYPGEVTYGGVLHVGPESIPPDQYDPTINYFWVHNWKYLVPFPPPTVDSWLSYRFKVSAQTNIFWGGGEGMVMAFVSVGETGNLTTGANIVPDIDGGWPLIHDLNQPADYYNGHYGFVDGEVTVQRSFWAPGNHVPAVAIVVGAIAALSMMSELSLVSANYSWIGVGSESRLGRVSYLYEPDIVPTV
jgi:hypothetical protein